MKPLQTLECVSRFNRTTVECKYNLCWLNIRGYPSFNRTTVECKYKDAGLLDREYKVFNRTTVAYKSLI